MQNKAEHITEKMAILFQTWSSRPRKHGPSANGDAHGWNFSSTTGGGTYTHLLVNCQLNGHLADVNEQAEARFFRLVEQMKEAEGVTEELKATDQMRWVGLMNNIAACAREIVYNELIYV